MGGPSRDDRVGGKLEARQADHHTVEDHEPQRIVVEVLCILTGKVEILWYERHGYASARLRGLRHGIAAHCYAWFLALYGFFAFFFFFS